MKTFRDVGQRISWTNSTGSDVASGDVVVIANMVGIAVAAIANGDTGTLEICNEHVIAAVTAEAWKTGASLFWDISLSKLTRYSSGDCVPAGPATADKAASATTARVKLNAGASISPELLDLVWEDVDDNKTLDIQDVGKVMNVTVDAKTITLPATAAGLRFIIRNGGADAAVAVTISPNANDKIMGADLAGVDDKDRVNTKATALSGDYLVLAYGGATGYLVTRERGTWAAEA